MPRKELTERQQRVVLAIKQWIQEHGYPPTIRELGAQLGIKSLRGVTTHLDAIAKKGFLLRKRGARGLRLLQEHAVSGIEPVWRVPIVGRVAAGSPLLAEEHLEGHLTIDPVLVGSSASAPAAGHFALRVQGMSMQGAGILDGDYVIVRQQPSADNGEIVVALLGDEATVKRFVKAGDQIQLQPEHPEFSPIVVEPDQPVAILGKVVAVFRPLA